MATPVDPLFAGEVVARRKLLIDIRARATLCSDLARGVRTGTIDPKSATAEGLDAMSGALLLLLGSESIRLYRDEASASPAPPPPRGLWARLRWLFTGT